ncbi:phosphotransferase family protein [Geminicoccus flavidas]|uniref:phosphotransferase family protein n=1 Tax=Geminicoccus flavidas TaxID=2506407 RepID=UPI00190FB064|nr:phosphotransferase [Geminicoccus flavidas]
MSELDPHRGRATAAVTALLAEQAPDAAEAQIVLEPAFAVLASPGWHGVDGVHFKATLPDGTRRHVKSMHEDAGHYVEVRTAFAAAKVAAGLGIGPRVDAVDLGNDTLVMEDCAGFRTGTLDRLRDPEIVANLLRQRQAFHKTGALGRQVSVFDEIRRFHDACRSAGAPLPADIDWLVDNVMDAERAILAAGFDLVPAHGDGNASNFLVGPDKQVLLVDWDRAADMDPFADLGSFIVEAAQQEPEARGIFMMAHGAMDEALFARTMLYGIADHLRWGLIGFLLAKVSTRPSLEFLKYGSWRFFHCRQAVREPRFAERLRRV